MSTNVAPAVEARDLTKRYGDFEAVRAIDFTIARQECFGFLGVNGAGKTSTMKMIYCRTTKTSGRLDVFGMDAAAHPREIKSRIGVVTQDNALDPELTKLADLTPTKRASLRSNSFAQRPVVNHPSSAASTTALTSSPSITLPETGTGFVPARNFFSADCSA